MLFFFCDFGGSIRYDLTQTVDASLVVRDNEGRAEHVNRVGKQFYMSPQILAAKQYNPKCTDIWSSASACFTGQLKRRTIDALIKTTPADGIVTGIGVVNGELFQHQPQSQSMTRTGILSYDYGKYSKRRRSNVAVIIVKVIFISAFLFYCLLLNHTFPTNPNKITNCFQLFSLLQLYNYIATSIHCRPPIIQSLRSLH